MAKSAEGTTVRLTRDDWIDAAWTALSEGSLDTVKVDRLAKRLKVTRGSFYWHFSKREDLIDAVVDRWLHRLSRAVAVQHLLDAEKPAAEKLWDVFEYVIRNVTGPQSVFLRIAAAENGRLQARIDKEDLDRILGYRQIFSEMGLGEDTAQDFAEHLYIVVMSEFLRRGALSLDARLALGRRHYDFILRAAQCAIKAESP